MLLISGLGGTGASWGRQPRLLTDKYFVIVADQRGTGRSTHAESGHTTPQLAADTADLLDAMDVDPVHLVDSATGGAIAQHMALSRPGLVETLVLSSSFARLDPYLRREFEVLRRMATEWDRVALMSAYSLFLFSPRFTFEHPERVQQWIDAAVTAPTQPQDGEIGLRRIDMIASHDTVDRLGDIAAPTLVLCGTHNMCTLLHNSEILAERILGARLVTFDEAGELVELEQPDRYAAELDAFFRKHRHGRTE